MRTYALTTLLAAAIWISPTIASPIILKHGVNATITATTTPGDNASDADDASVRSLGIVYDSLSLEGNVQTPTTGLGGSITEDYVSDITSPSTLDTLRFGGGVDTANHIVFFEFLDTNMQFVDGFGVQLPAAGQSFIWQIAMTDPTLVTVPAEGYLRLRADDGSNNSDGLPTDAAWRFKDVAPAVGTTTGDVYRMRLNVIPEPASAALLALGGLVMLHRRKHQSRWEPV